jgi:prevent-host-death family protein
LECRILASTARNGTPPPSAAKPTPRPRAELPAGYWSLRDAKAKFGELVRRVHRDGPRHVTVHGRDEVVVMSAEEFRRLRGGRTGAALVEAMQASPHRDAEIEPRREAMPVRTVEL